MKFETLKQGKKKKFIIGIVIVLVVVATISLVGTKAKYQTTQSIKIAEGTVNYTLGDMNTMAIYLNGDNGYEQADSIPESGYELNATESYCKIGDTKQDVTINYDFDTKSLSISPLTKGKMKCYLYFDIKPPTASDIILANMPTVTTRGSITGPNTASTTGTIYTAEDDDGTSYYFSGNPTDNWVRFAGFYWRIIRINGDGTIRMIYQGTAANTTGEGTQTTTSAFTSSYNNNMYVGYMYTSGSVHGTGTASTIKGVLDTWYDSNLASYASYIDTNAGFCNDRQPSTSNSSSNGSGGTGTTTTYYGAYIRFYTGGSWANPQAPTYKCQNSSDLFTVSSSSNGNKALSRPIGLITVDEVVYGGGFGGSSNSSYYLYTGQYYWTMSPYYFNSSLGVAGVFFVQSNGNLNDYVSGASGVRPVINLKADTRFTGSGTASNPYIVQLTS